MDVTALRSNQIGYPDQIHELVQNKGTPVQLSNEIRSFLN